MNTRSKLSLFGAGLFVMSLLVLAGCQSASEPGSASHASVQIKGHSLAEVQQTVATVFREEGYTLTVSTPQEMTFDRPGTRRDIAKWGGYYGGLIMRVKVNLSDTLEGGHLLQADAYAVQNASENRNILVSRKPYQNLLDEVASRLK